MGFYPLLLNCELSKAHIINMELKMSIRKANHQLQYLTQLSEVFNVVIITSQGACEQITSTVSSCNDE